MPMAEMPNQIRVCYTYLESLHLNAQTAARMLKESSQLSSLDFSPNSRVTEAYDHYLDRWKDHREKLQQGLDIIAAAFKKAHDSFEAVEAELTKALQPYSD